MCCERPPLTLSWVGAEQAPTGWCPLRAVARVEDNILAPSSGRPPVGLRAALRPRLVDSGAIERRYVWSTSFPTTWLPSRWCWRAGPVALYVLQSLQVTRLKRRIEQLTGGVEDGDLETVLGQHLETVHQVGRDLDELTERLAVLEIASRHHFSRQALIRFNPFPDTGGNQSFALALLDESDDGVIVSSLHSRTGTRIYAKAVTGGKADTSLSTEEQDAIDEARSRRPARPATPPRSAAASRTAPAASGAAACPGRPRPARPTPGAGRWRGACPG